MKLLRLIALDYKKIQKKNIEKRAIEEEKANNEINDDDDKDDNKSDNDDNEDKNANLYPNSQIEINSFHVELENLKEIGDDIEKDM